MWGLLARGALLAGKFFLKRPLMSLIGADMATGGHSTDIVLDTAQASGKVIGKDNAKTIGEGLFSLLSAFNASAFRVGGKTLERLGTGVKDHFASQKAQGFADTAPAAGRETNPEDETKGGKKDKHPFSLSSIFDFSAKGGLGAILGGMTGNPVLMIFGAIMAIFMMGRLGGDHGKPEHKQHLTLH